MITSILADADLGSLKAEFLKQQMTFLICFGVALSFVVTAVVAVMQYLLDKKSKAREDKRSKEPQPRTILPTPLETDKVSRRYNHDAVKTRFETIESDIERHEREITEIRDNQTEISTDIDKQISELPGKIVVDILNAQKLGRHNDD